MWEEMISDRGPPPLLAVGAEQRVRALPFAHSRTLPAADAAESRR